MSWSPNWTKILNLWSLLLINLKAKPNYGTNLTIRGIEKPKTRRNLIHNQNMHDHTKNMYKHLGLGMRHFKWIQIIVEILNPKKNLAKSPLELGCGKNFTNRYDFTIYKIYSSDSHFTHFIHFIHRNTQWYSILIISHHSSFTTKIYDILYTVGLAGLHMTQPTNQNT